MIYSKFLARGYLADGNITTLDKLKALEIWISENLDADSVRYNSLEAFVEALKIPKESLFLKCWDGNSPITLLEQAE